jgi:hypothetical protein
MQFIAHEGVVGFYYTAVWDKTQFPVHFKSQVDAQCSIQHFRLSHKMQCHVCSA